MQGLSHKIRTAPVTMSLIAVSIAVYALESFWQIGPRSPDFSRWALSGEALARGYWWTLLTHMFLHGNLLHLMVNILALIFVGPEVEFTLGRVRYLVLYIVSGMAGGLLQTAFSMPGIELIGASGAVCGVILSFTTAYPEAPLRALLFFIIPVNMKAKMLGWGLMLASLFMAVLHIVPQIGHWAHLGGAVAGSLLTRWWLRRSTPARPRSVGRVTPTATDELLERVMNEGLESLNREERQHLEALAEARERRTNGRR
jgi:membrane associated rhomboid family serine protease